jgi:hypothetical protein
VLCQLSYVPRLVVRQSVERPVLHISDQDGRVAFRHTSELSFDLLRLRKTNAPIAAATASNFFMMTPGVDIDADFGANEWA